MYLYCPGSKFLTEGLLKFELTSVKCKNESPMSRRDKIINSVLIFRLPCLWCLEFLTLPGNYRVGYVVNLFTNDSQVEHFVV